MGSTLVLVFLAFFVLAIGQAFFRRARNPYAEVAYGQLPETLRSEIDRVLPGFAPERAKMTRRGDEARTDGQYRGGSVHVEADFAPDGALVEFEIDTRRGCRKTGLASEGDLPGAVRAELDRVVGPDRAELRISNIKTGKLTEGETVYEVNGRSGDWKWEIEITESGQLVELEKEKRLRRS